VAEQAYFTGGAEVAVGIVDAAVVVGVDRCGDRSASSQWVRILWRWCGRAVGF
jgi:hypothetical protein